VTGILVTDGRLDLGFEHLLKLGLGDELDFECLAVALEESEGTRAAVRVEILVDVPRELVLHLANHAQ